SAAAPQPPAASDPPSDRSGEHPPDVRSGRSAPTALDPARRRRRELGPAVRAGRRDLLLTGGGVLLLASGSGLGRRVPLARGTVTTARKPATLPRAASPARPAPAGAQVRVPGMTPFVTANAGFYRVDTALTLPQVSPRDWMLRVHGMVDRPIELSF